MHGIALTDNSYDIEQMMRKMSIIQKLLEFTDEMSNFVPG